MRSAYYTLSSQSLWFLFPLFRSFPHTVHVHTQSSLLNQVRSLPHTVKGTWQTFLNNSNLFYYFWFMSGSRYCSACLLFLYLWWRESNRTRILSPYVPKNIWGMVIWYSPILIYVSFQEVLFHFLLSFQKINVKNTEKCVHTDFEIEFILYSYLSR